MSKEKFISKEDVVSIGFEITKEVPNFIFLQRKIKDYPDFIIEVMLVRHKTHINFIHPGSQSIQMYNGVVKNKEFLIELVESIELSQTY